MAELKTLKNKNSVKKFIESVDNETRRKDAYVLLEMFERVTGKKPVMWGTSIIGFDQYHYKSTRSKQEGDWPMIGFSPRKANLSLYLMPGTVKFENKLKKLGKHKTAVACLYINKLADVDLKVLEEIVKEAYKHMKTEYKHC